MHDAWACKLVKGLRGNKVNMQRNKVAKPMHWFPWPPHYGKIVSCIGSERIVGQTPGPLEIKTSAPFLVIYAGSDKNELNWRESKLSENTEKCLTHTERHECSVERSTNVTTTDKGDDPVVKSNPKSFADDERERMEAINKEMEKLELLEDQL